MYRLIKRSRPPYTFNATLFKTLDEAVWAARENEEDYLIEETPGWRRARNQSRKIPSRKV
jgi:hypothetical protein